MPKKTSTPKQLLLELEDLRARLDEAEETLRAIHSGQVDALVVPGVSGEQIFTLKSVDYSYRLLIEEMSEGALTLSAEGVILYANRHFAEMLKTPLEKVIGSTIHTWIAPTDLKTFQSLLQKGADEKRREELALTTSDGIPVPVYLSVNRLLNDEMPNSFCLVATDLTEQKRNAGIIAAEKSARELLEQSEHSRRALLSVLEDQKQVEKVLAASEAELRESETRYRALVEQAADGIFITDIQGRYLEVNTSGCAMLGYKSEEILGADYTLILLPEDLVQAPPNLDRLVAGQTLLRERLYKRKDGTVFPVEINAKMLSDGRIQSIVRDITERKRAENAIAEERNLLRTLIDNLPDNVYIKDAESRYVINNPAHLRSLGATRQEDVLGKTAFDFFPQPRAAQYYAEEQSIIRSGQPMNEQEDLSADLVTGQQRWLLAKKVPIRDSQGKVVGIVGVSRDITERKQAEQTLIESNAQFRTLFEASPDAILLIDPHDRWSILDCNIAACQMNGYTRDELVGQSVDVLNLTPGDPTERVGYLERIRESGVLRLETLHRRKDGTVFPVEVSTSMIALGGRDIVLGIDRDITEREQAEEEIAHLIEEQQTSLAMTTRLYELSARILAAPTMAETAQLVIETVLAGFAADACTINFFSETAGDTVGFRQSVGFSPTFHEEARHRPQGLTARVRASKEPIIATAEELNPRVRAEGIQTNIALPLPGEKENIGALFVGYRQPHQFSAHERNLLSLFANQAALALRRMRLLHQIEQRLSELEAIHTISTALRDVQTRDQALPILLDETLTALETDAGAICLYHPDQNELRNSIARGWFRQFDDVPMKPGEGIVGTVFATGQVHITTEFKSDPIVRQRIGPAGWGGICVPIRAGVIMVGTLTVSLPPPRQITPEQVKLLESLSGMAGTTLHRLSLHEETVHRLEQLQALHNIDLAISASVDLRMTLDILLGHALTQLKVDAAVVLLLNPYSQILEYAAGRGFRTRGAQNAKIHLGEDFAGRVALERRTIQAENPAQAEKRPAFAALWTGEGFAAYFGVPLIAKGKVRGVLEIYHRTPFHAESDWISFLETLAGQAAIAIESAQLFEKLQRSNTDLERAYDATIEGWSHALDLRDKETEGHTQRVTEITIRLAKAMGVSDADLVHARRGALLHDIGKMGVPDNILLKPGKLTDEEWVLMRKHPQLSYDLLSPISYLRAALEIPYCHHEKWDGTGYPRGLKGEQIPLVARLFAIVDVWDALRSDRPYRLAWHEDKVREHLQSLSGTHFDPNLVPVFLRLIEQTL